MKDIQVGQEDGDLRYKLAQILKGHWLTGSGCSHEGEGSNAASCWCGWTGDRVGSLGEAINTWISHVLEEMRPHLAEAIEVAAARPQPAQSGVVEALRKLMPIRVHDGPDYAEVYFADGSTHSTQAMTRNPQDWRDLQAAFDATLPTPPAGES